MNNADVFKQVFGIYATELWAMEEKDFLKWLNSEHEPQRTGHWKRYWVGTIAEGLFCDVCHKRGYGEDTCPNCGARMESE